LGDRARLAHEPVAVRVVAQHLDRDAPLELRIDRLEHDPHRAGADGRDDLIAPDRLRAALAARGHRDEPAAVVARIEVCARLLARRRIERPRHERVHDLLVEVRHRARIYHATGTSLRRPTGVAATGRSDSCLRRTTKGDTMSEAFKMGGWGMYPTTI